MNNLDKANVAIDNAEQGREVSYYANLINAAQQALAEQQQEAA